MTSTDFITQHFTYILLSLQLRWCSVLCQISRGSIHAQGYQQLTEETQPLLVASGVTKKESVAGQDQKAKKVKITY